MNKIILNNIQLNNICFKTRLMIYLKNAVEHNIIIFSLLFIPINPQKLLYSGLKFKTAAMAQSIELLLWLHNIGDRIFTATYQFFFKTGNSSCTTNRSTVVNITEPNEFLKSMFDVWKCVPGKNNLDTYRVINFDEQTR